MVRSLCFKLTKLLALPFHPKKRCKSRFILEIERSVKQRYKRPLFFKKKPIKGTSDLSNPYVHVIFTLLLVKLISKKKTNHMTILILLPEITCSEQLTDFKINLRRTNIMLNMRAMHFIKVHRNKMLILQAWRVWYFSLKSQWLDGLIQ